MPLAYTLDDNILWMFCAGFYGAGDIIKALGHATRDRRFRPNITKCIYNNTESRSRVTRDSGPSIIAAFQAARLSKIAMVVASVQHCWGATCLVSAIRDSCMIPAEVTWSADAAETWVQGEGGLLRASSCSLIKCPCPNQRIGNTDECPSAGCVDCPNCASSICRVFFKMPVR
mgnify:CR=1 FL=1